jgi:hypothetical protein
MCIDFEVKLDGSLPSMSNCLTVLFGFGHDAFRQKVGIEFEILLGFTVFSANKHTTKHKPTLCLARKGYLHSISAFTSTFFFTLLDFDDPNDSFSLEGRPKKAKGESLH